MINRINQRTRRKSSMSASSSTKDVTLHHRLLCKIRHTLAPHYVCIIVNTCTWKCVCCYWAEKYFVLLFCCVFLIQNIAFEVMTIWYWSVLHEIIKTEATNEERIINIVYTVRTPTSLRDTQNKTHRNNRGTKSIKKIVFYLSDKLPFVVFIHVVFNDVIKALFDKPHRDTGTTIHFTNTRSLRTNSP
jgi:hypothetical protein